MRLALVETDSATRDGSAGVLDWQGFMRIGHAFWAFATALVAAAPALAAPVCLANGQSFQIGQTACLMLAGKSELARCDVVLNNTSWTKIQNDCSLSKSAPQLDGKPLPDQAQPSATPNEPAEN